MKIQSKSTILALILSLLSFPSFSQIDQFILGSLGGEVKNGQIAIIQSLGDLAGDSQGDNLILIQGFSQCFNCNSCFGVGIEEAFFSPSVNFLPNPAQERIMLEGELHLMDSYEVYDLSGKQVLKGEVQNEVISISSLAKGIFILKVFGQKGELSLIGKLIKE